VEDVVQGYLVVWREKRFFDIFPGLLEVGTLIHHFLHTFVAEFEAADGCAANVVRIRRVLHNESLVVQNGTRDQPLDNEFFMRQALVVWDGELDDTRLNHDQSIDHLMVLKNRAALFISFSFHVIQ
jgi:hypothetical protein